MTGMALLELPRELRRPAMPEPVVGLPLEVLPTGDCVCGLCCAKVKPGMTRVKANRVITASENIFFTGKASEMDGG